MWLPIGSLITGSRSAAIQEEYRAGTGASDPLRASMQLFSIKQHLVFKRLCLCSPTGQLLPFDGKCIEVKKRMLKMQRIFTMVHLRDP